MEMIKLFSLESAVKPLFASHRKNIKARKREVLITLSTPGTGWGEVVGLLNACSAKVIESDPPTLFGPAKGLATPSRYCHVFAQCPSEVVRALINQSSLMPVIHVVRPCNRVQLLRFVHSGPQERLQPRSVSLHPNADFQQCRVLEDVRQRFWKSLEHS